MSKFSKFLRSPKLFIMDSKIYNKILRSQVDYDPRVSALQFNNISVVGYRESFTDIIKQKYGVLVYEDLDKGSDFKHVGILARHQYDLVNSLLSISKIVNLQQKYRGKFYTVNEANKVKLEEAVSKEKSLVIDFKDTGSNRLKIYFWNEHEDFFECRKKNRYAKKIFKSKASSNLFVRGFSFKNTELFKNDIDFEHNFKVDIVYTWVNHNDEDWKRLYSNHNPNILDKKECDATGMDRFFNRDELLYSLRSVDEFVPWCNNIFIVSNCAPPKWLNVDHPRIRWIDHSEIIEEEFLPTFSSHAIESRLHKISELSNQFLYLNDDMFFASQSNINNYFLSNGLSVSLLEDYGVVNGEVTDGAPDYLNAARNGQKLISDKFSATPTSLHRHSPYALRKDVIESMERNFPESFTNTAKNKFRTKSDISVTSFLYHHYSYQIEKSVRNEYKAILIKSTSNYEKIFSDLLSKNFCKTFCINDGGVRSSDNIRWNESVGLFLDRMYPVKSQFEC